MYLHGLILHVLNGPWWQRVGRQGVVDGDGDAAGLPRGIL